MYRLMLIIKDSINQNDNIKQWEIIMGLLALRIALGSIFLIHGNQKIKMWKMQPSAQLPARMLSILRLLSITEPLGGIAILIGFLTQWAAVGIGIIMIGAIVLKAVQMKKKFSGDGGWEFDVILLAAAVLLLFAGAGHISVDHILK